MKGRQNPRQTTVPCWLLFFAVFAIPALFVQPGRTQWVNFNNCDDIRAVTRQGETLWIGTNGGIILYDMLMEEVSGKITIGSTLPSNSIRALANQGDYMYAGTDRGLSIFKPGQVLIYSGEQHKCFSQIRHISFSQDGAVLLGTFGSGVAVLKNDSVGVITKADSLLDNKVYSIYMPDDGTAYYATSLGLCAYIDSAWVSYQAGYGIPRGEVKALAQAGDGRFYMVVGGKGLFIFNGRRARRLPSGGIFRENEIAAITIARDQSLWAAGRYGGIARYQYGNWTVIGESDPEVSQAKWRCAYTDSLGIVYFGSANGILVSIEDGKLKKRRLDSALVSNHVGEMMEDPSGELLFVNGNVVLRSSERGFSEEVPPGMVLAMAISPDGTLWISTRWGVFRKENGFFHEVTPELTGLRSYFLSMAFDSVGNLWAGSFLGEVYRYDGELWMLYGDSDELFRGPVDELIVDARGRIWALNRDLGVSVFDGVSWRGYPSEEFGPGKLKDVALDNSGCAVVLTSKSIWRYSSVRGWSSGVLPPHENTGSFEAIAFDGMGRIYLGTESSLVLLDGGKVEMIGPAGGLGGLGIVSMIVDSKEWLWIGFRKDGLSRARIDQLWRFLFD